MKTGKTLVELATELTRIQNSKKDFIVPTSQMHMNDNAQIEFKAGSNTQQIDINTWSGAQIASYTDIPKTYFDRIREENPILLANNVNHGFKNAVSSSEKEARLVRTIDGKCRGFLSSRYRMLDAHDLLEATLPTLMENKFEVLSSEVTDKRLYLKTATQRIQGEVKVGDVVQYGVMISTSDVGAGSLKVEPFFYRLSCLNGMIMETKFRKAHLGSNNYEKHVMELLTDDTKKLNDQAFYATVRDYLKATMQEDIFERELNKMRDAANQKITNFDLEKVVELSMKEVGIIGEKSRKGILAALASGNEGAGLTKWGLVNSFTKAAHDVNIDYDTATELERAGGSILDLTASQWKRVAQEA